MTTTTTRTTAVDAGVISVFTLLSRTTGFVRVLVVGAVLGRGALGDLYQTVNSVPNVLFELLAGGALQAALVPAFVEAERTDPVHGLDRAASAVTRAMLRYLGVATGIGLLAAPAVVWLLTLAEPDAQVAGDKWRLGTWMLWMFLPQLIWYGAGIVATAALAARRRFAAAAIAPLVNNAVVIGAYLAFDRLRGSRRPDLQLSVVELIVLAGGTTFAVAAFTSVPVIAARRAGLRCFARGAEGGRDAVRSLRRSGGWAVFQVAATLSLQLCVLVVGNGAGGGVALFSWGLTFFLLPSALIAMPVATALAPRLADLHQRDAGVGVGPLVRTARNVVLTSGALAAVGLFALAWPIVRLLPLGELGRGDLAPVAHTLQAFAPGIVGYGAWALASRALFSLGQVRGAAIDMAAAAAVGALAMVVVSELVDGDERATALAGAYGGAFTLAGVLVWFRLHRALGPT